ncbi:MULTISPECIES: ECF transporter S component [Brevibacillus]|jgi:riboflavin transporter FmnP|uniref:Riboflavin transporter n=1 Tax=Brevibacillus parabrevis TaxID=54914 RepID=A0A4Y3PQB4_BREPA|nr:MULTISPECIES: ECF transporter S component [Brevibacillus]MBU8716310.1 ECF transporter S component [Brevibacillus parabrevis]MDH6352286.1 riboflavin transporter FmnP [Brevibacillus sp. 1238]MDR5000103.1 ECF transporter S component [Brevibacillus parabrevis]MED1725484.1 ECF transporter S component [Brevibacillus parabrevis]MED2255272.1 ECF transporter S component [Brevibacillus parabrevis]
MKETALHTSRRATQRIVTIPMLAAVAFILQYLEVPVPLMPSFLKLDFSTLPALIGGLMYGPVAGIIIEVLKNTLHMLFKNTDGLLIGELANVVAGASFILPAVLLQRSGQGKKGFLSGLALGTLLMTIVMAVANAYVLLPAYAALYQMPMAELLAMFNATSVWSLVMVGIVPFNLFKGVVLALVAYPVYAKLGARIALRTTN